MKEKAKKEFGEATLASIMKEMAKPRMAKSAREEEANRAAARIMPVKRGKAKLQSHAHPLPLLRRARYSGYCSGDEGSIERPFLEHGGDC